MRKVVIEKQRLLDTVVANREKHAVEYEEARSVYLDKAQALFEKKAAEAGRGEPVGPQIDLEEPVEFLEEYDQAIQMIEMDEREEIELTEEEFQKLVRDEWTWSRQFQRRTSSYT